MNHSLVLSNLKLISSVKVGDTISTTTGQVIPKNTFSTRMHRWWYAENRHETFKFIEQSIDDAIRILEDPQDDPYKPEIAEALWTCKGGLNNLCAAYENCAEQLRLINDFISKINHFRNKLEINIQSSPRSSSPCPIEKNSLPNLLPMEQSPTAAGARRSSLHNHLTNLLQNSSPVNRGSLALKTSQVIVLGGHEVCIPR